MYKLNCIVLGDDPRRVFEIEIAPTASVSALQKAIKNVKKRKFDHVDADSLELWQVDLPFNETIKHSLSSLTLDTNKSLSPMTKLQKVFSKIPEDEHLHIVIQGSPAMSSGPLHLKLNCIVLGDNPRHAFEIEIAQTASVSALQKAIKDVKKRKFDHVDADSLELWQVKINLNDTHLLKAIGNEGVELKPLTKLSEVFANEVECGCIHVVIRQPAVAQHVPVVDERSDYLARSTGAPSADGKPLAFAKIQDTQQYLCNRPREAADPVPVTLLEPIFAEFVDGCQNHQPTARDNEFIRQLSTKMSSFYLDELTRMKLFRQMLNDYGIPLHASLVGSTKCTTDGHYLTNKGRFVQVIIKGKNEIGSGSAEPFAEAILYYRKILKESETEMGKLRSFLPCIHIIVFGACVGFAGSVFAKKVQSDVLVPIIPLFWHSRDLSMQAMAARAFGALKIAIDGLTNLYSCPIPFLEPNDPYIECPYPRSYISSTGHNQKFSYDEPRIRRDRLIFFGETVGDAAGNKICIKFVRHYSPDAHKFCASKGHAPKLIAYNPLPGGWNMVIMDALDIDNDCFSPRPGSYRLLSEIDVSDRQPLKEAITSLIRELHNAGYVHGDLRDANFVVGDNKHFMLLDFDWAGLMQKTYYPMYVNRQDIRRPDGASDGEKIVAEHDLDMLNYMFHPEQDGREPAAKRRRMSGGGSPMAI